MLEELHKYLWDLSEVTACLFITRCLKMEKLLSLVSFLLRLALLCHLQHYDGLDMSMVLCLDPKHSTSY